VNFKGPTIYTQSNAKIAVLSYDMLSAVLPANYHDCDNCNTAVLSPVTTGEVKRNNAVIIMTPTPPPPPSESSPSSEP
jgi:hypothetical protein